MTNRLGFMLQQRKTGLTKWNLSQTIDPAPGNLQRNFSNHVNSMQYWRYIQAYAVFCIIKIVLIETIVERRWTPYNCSLISQKEEWWLYPHQTIQKTFQLLHKNEGQEMEVKNCLCWCVKKKKKQLLSQTSHSHREQYYFSVAIAQVVYAWTEKSNGSREVINKHYMFTILRKKTQQHIFIMEENIHGHHDVYLHDGVPICIQILVSDQSSVRTL